MKKKTAVEDLLVWAYRDQMVHVAREVELVALAPSYGSGAAGPGYYGNGYATEIVDNSHKMGFTAASDAFAVHRAVQALSSVRCALPADVVGRVDARAVFGHAERVDAKVSMPDVGALFSINRGKLVMSAALDGKRPDWIERPELRCEKGEIIYERDRKGRVRYDAAGRPRISLYLVRFVGDMPWDVARARLVYAVWVAALGVLRARLDGALERHQVTELLPEECPWAK